jgi:hypothetical protein
MLKEKKAKKQNQSWCSVCQMYLFGIDAIPHGELLLGCYHVSQPRTPSIFHIGKYLEGTDTLLSQSFCPIYIYKEITLDEVEIIQSQIDDLPHPQNPNDVSVFNETLIILQFCRYWLEKGATILFKQVRDLSCNRAHLCI